VPKAVVALGPLKEGIRRKMRERKSDFDGLLKREEEEGSLMNGSHRNYHNIGYRPGCPAPE
jgi:hypothetical protein